MSLLTGGNGKSSSNFQRRIRSFPNGVDIPEAPRSESWRPGGRLRLLYLGRLHLKKGRKPATSVKAVDSEAITLTICGSEINLFTEVASRLFTS